MPLLTDEVWTFRCGVCGLDRQMRPGRFPEGWRRLNVRAQTIGWATHGLADGWRAMRFEDWVCSLGCAVAAVSRSFDPVWAREHRESDLAMDAARDAAAARRVS